MGVRKGHPYTGHGPRRRGAGGSGVLLRKALLQLADAGLGKEAGLALGVGAVVCRVGAGLRLGAGISFGVGGVAFGDAGLALGIGAGAFALEGGDVPTGGRVVPGQPAISPADLEVQRCVVPLQHAAWQLLDDDGFVAAVHSR